METEIIKSFDSEKLQTILAEYKKRFKNEIWPGEEYKWKAIKVFQDNWNINDSDFMSMLANSLKSTRNLLTSSGRFAEGMIVKFAKLFPDDVREMYIYLFDENIDVYDRISRFIDKSDELLERWKRNDGITEKKMHFQDINAVTTYLWLKYPDKYYIYKPTIVKKVVEKLGSSYEIKRSAYANNVRTFLKLYDEIREELQKDDELVSILNECISPDCYPDHYLNTLTVDFGFYICKRHHDSSENPNIIYGEDYDSGLTEEDWIDLLNNHNVFTDNALLLMACYKDIGGIASCRKLSDKYGRNFGFYNTSSSNLAKRIIKETGCPTPKNSDGSNAFWPVLYTGRVAERDEPGDFVWMLRPEISSALDYVDLSNINIYASEDDVDDSGHSYWWLNSNPRMWSFTDLAVDEYQEYDLYNENGNKRRIFQNFLDAKVGDKVIGYESTPTKQIVALAEVSKAQDGKEIQFRKTESLENPVDYKTLKECDELMGMEYFANPQGSLFKLSEDEFNFIMDLIRETNPSEKKDVLDKYDETDFLNDVYMTKERYSDLVSVLKTKKNIILHGAPGVGKTFAAKRLAYSIMGVKDESRIEFVQFHQNYSYEDFVMGYKPNETGFELKTGIFYRFCQKASNKPEEPFFFIIDEINRGNMSKIFGELLMLIEKDYRGTKATMAYNGMPFSVPDNLYIIGMMNTADRSLAMIDYALRRRFSFFEMSPGFETEGFINYQNDIRNDTFDELIARICDLNKEITSDKALGKGFCIGHSYFCNIDDCSEELLESIVKYEIIPMLEEYWFDDETKLKRWSNTLLGIFNE